MIAVLVLIVVLGGGGAALLLSGGGGHHPATSNGSSSTTTTGTTTTPITTVATTVAPPSDTTPTVAPTVGPTPPGLTSIAGYLAQSAMARIDVGTATQGVENCNEAPATALNQLNAAIALRQGIAANLGGVDLSGVAGGPALRSTLVSAINHSIAADQDFVLWINDVQAANTAAQGQSAQGQGAPGQGAQGQGAPGQGVQGAPLPCSQYMTDAHWMAGNDQSVAATNDKTSFVAAWNPLAATYGLKTYPVDGF